MEDIYWITLFYTRLAMLAVVALGFAWARMEHGQLLLVEMGLLSFIAVSPVRARHPARALLAARQPQGRLRGDLGRLLRVVLHADHPGPGQGGGALGASFLVERAARACGCCAPPRSSASTGSTPSATGSSGRSSSTWGSSCWCRCSPSRTPTTGPRPPPSWARRSRTRPAPGAPAILSAHRDRAARPPLRRRRGRGGDRARAVRRQGARRSVGAGAARAAHPLRAAARRLPGRGGRAHDRGGPLHDLEGGGPAARHLLPADAAVAAGHRGGGQARRAAARLGGRERGRLHLHRGHRPAGSSP